MSRRHQTFTVDAAAAQEGAEVTFRALKVRDVTEYNETEMTDEDLLRKQIVGWTGFVDDEGRDLPSPLVDPDVIGELYLHEKQALLRLLFQGPLGDSAKN
jgi:hypothetical protein